MVSLGWVGPEPIPVEANRLRLGRFEFVIDFGSFRRITQSWSGPGWDFNFSGVCVNDDPAEVVGANRPRDAGARAGFLSCRASRLLNYGVRHQVKAYEGPHCYPCGSGTGDI